MSTQDETAAARRQNILNTLRVQFKSGGTYDYHGVTPEQYDDLAKAESVGKHLHAHIKPNHTFSNVDVKGGAA